jgi:hypothetical protein
LAALEIQPIQGTPEHQSAHSTASLVPPFHVFDMLLSQYFDGTTRFFNQKTHHYTDLEYNKIATATPASANPNTLRSK